MTAQSMNRRIESLQHEPASSIVRRQLIEEPRLHEYDKGRTRGDKEVGTLEVILHADATACPWCTIVVALPIIIGFLEGNRLHRTSRKIFKPRLHPELVVVE